MEREDDLLCIYYSMSCLKYYFFFRATVMEESQLEVFLRVLRFSPLLKNQQFQIPIRPGIR